jgi:hypothetical protein
MTAEEMEAKMAQLEAKNAELEAKIPAPVATIDPDLQYKPGTWKALDERETAKAEAAAVKVLKEAEEKKDAEKKRQDEAVAEQKKKIDEAFEALQKDGIVAEVKDRNDPNDPGVRQRKQVLASLVRSGGQHVDVEARKFKTAWDRGLEYDDVRNEFVPVGQGTNPNRDAYVGSSANRVATPAAPGKISMRGVGGDLDEARRRWELTNGKI